MQIDSTVRVASGVRVYDKYLRIGANSWIGPDTRLISCSHGSITIGECVDIAPCCILSTGTHKLGSFSRRAGEPAGGDITIGDGTWIGMGSVIIAGAHVGAGCVIGAGAVVIQGEYPANVLLAGVPARVIKTLP